MAKNNPTLTPLPQELGKGLGDGVLLREASFGYASRRDRPERSESQGEGRGAMQAEILKEFTP